MIPLVSRFEMLLAEEDFEFVLEDDILTRIDMAITYDFESGIPAPPYGQIQSDDYQDA